MHWRLPASFWFEFEHKSISGIVKQLSGKRTSIYKHKQIDHPADSSLWSRVNRPIRTELDNTVWYSFIMIMCLLWVIDIFFLLEDGIVSNFGLIILKVYHIVLYQVVFMTICWWLFVNCFISLNPFLNPYLHFPLWQYQCQALFWLVGRSFVCLFFCLWCALSPWCQIKALKPVL